MFRGRLQAVVHGDSFAWDDIVAVILDESISCEAPLLGTEVDMSRMGHDSRNDPEEGEGRTSFADPLERLVAEGVERFERDGEAALDEFYRAHPGHSEFLRREIETLRQCGMLEAPSDASSLPERLGDFHILGRLGGGGMGIVHRARQESLDRIVALKLIRPEFLFFDGARERFRREAAAIARLHHPGIVPIYSVGEEGNVPFFAMELVEGATLAEVLEDLGDRPEIERTGRDVFEAVRRRADLDVGNDRNDEDGADTISATFDGSYVEACLRLIRQVADALEHAHARGILHRDVKPSNVMVTPTGRAMLVDFGLARTDDATKMTRTGAAPGSLPYMSPEQVRGEVVDERTDIYSLGVTLYEMFGFRSPYFGTSSEETRRRILDGKAPSLRKLNPSVGVDAETACLVAMDSERDARYAHAADFSRDLGHVVNRRSLEARRPRWGRRLLRWAQRHPAAALAAVLAVLLFVGTPSALLWQSLRSQEKLEEENRETRVREKTTSRVVEILISIFGLGNPSTLRDGEMSASDIVDNAVRYVRDLEEEPQIKSRLLETIGNVCRQQARYELAYDLYVEALEVQATLNDSRAMARLLVARSQWEVIEGRGEESKASALAAIRHAEGHDDLNWVRLRAAGCMANVLATEGHFDEARTWAERCAAATDATEPGEWAFVHASRAWCALREGHYAEAEREYREALPFAEQDMGHTNYFVTLGNLALVLKLQGKLDEARGFYERALILARRAYEGDHDKLATLLINVGSLHGDRGDVEKAGVDLDEGVAMMRRTLGDEHSQTVVARAVQAENLYRRGRWREAVETYDDIIPAQREVDSHDGRLALAQSLGLRADARLHSGELADWRLQAADLEGACVAYAEAGLTESVDRARVMHNLAHILDGKDDERAEKFFRESAALTERVPAADEGVRVEHLAHLGEFLFREGRVDPALEVFRDVETRFPDYRGDGSIHLARMYRTMSAIYERKRQAKPMAAAMAKAVFLFRTVLGVTNVETVRAVGRHGFLLLYSDKAKAVEVLTEAIRLEELVKDAESAENAEIWRSAVARALIDLGRYEDAEPFAKVSYAEMAKRYGKKSQVAGLALKNLVTLYEKLGRTEELAAARERLKGVIEELKAAKGKKP